MLIGLKSDNGPADNIDVLYPSPFRSPPVHQFDMLNGGCGVRRGYSYSSKLGFHLALNVNIACVCYTALYLINRVAKSSCCQELDS